MKRLTPLVLCFAVLLATSCRTQDVRTIEIYVPEMRNHYCADIVMKVVAGIPGVQPDKTVIDMKHRTVTVTYESLSLSLKNIEFTIADAGFAANKVPANEEARKKLPPECFADTTVPPPLAPSSFSTQEQVKVNLTP
jgi:copper chaperone CopZ